MDHRNSPRGPATPSPEKGRSRSLRRPPAAAEVSSPGAAVGPAAGPLATSGLHALSASTIDP